MLLLLLQYQIICLTATHALLHVVTGSCRATNNLHLFWTLLLLLLLLLLLQDQVMECLDLCAVEYTGKVAKLKADVGSSLSQIGK
jgi:hypothetical protein